MSRLHKNLDSLEIDHTGLSPTLSPNEGGYDDSDKSCPVVLAIPAGELSQLVHYMFPEGSTDQITSGPNQGESFAVKLGSLPGSSNLNHGTVYYWWVQALDNHNAESGFSDGTAHFVSAVTTAVGMEEGRTPSLVFLSGSWPNPFSHTTLMEFGMPVPGPVTLQVFDVQGKRVRRLVHKNYKSGIHRISWDGRDDRGHNLPSGVYFCRLETSGKVKTVKMVLIR